ncbi:MAG: hypothetical protein ACI8RD_012356 [Bacillariaceae sp.]|jgi:hypothetical protein
MCTGNGCRTRIRRCRDDGVLELVAALPVEDVVDKVSDAIDKVSEVSDDDEREKEKNDNDDFSLLLLSLSLSTSLLRTFPMSSKRGESCARCESFILLGCCCCLLRCCCCYCRCCNGSRSMIHHFLIYFSWFVVVVYFCFM